MSDSSSFESKGPPTDAQLEHALRDAVRNVFATGNLENLTVKRIRNHVETDLGLEANFFKSNDRWKEGSKAVIQSEVDAHDKSHKSSQLSPPSPDKAKRQAKASPKPAKAVSKTVSRGTKRASTESAEPKPKKRRKKSTPDVDGSTDEREQSVTKRPKSKPDPEPTLGPEPGSEDEAEDKEPKAGFEAGGGPDVQSDSDMSIVLDEDPNPKKRRRKSDSKPKAKGTGTGKSKRPSEAAADPDAEEIKRLQGWLVKCGIRKMWYKELAPYGSSRAKIKHLKEMLGDAGMTGRYSKEKADQIREERELKADLEAVQEGAKAWGTAEDQNKQGDGQPGSRPRRRLATGLEGLDFLNDNDGEETD